MFRKTSSLLLLTLLCFGCNEGPDQDTVVPEPAAPDTTVPDTTTPEQPMPSSGTTSTDAASTNSNDSAASESMVAVANLEPIGDSGVKGTVTFTAVDGGVKVTGEVTGLEPGKHGFHVHEKGDLSDKETGKSAGGHFNPTDQPHGKPSDEKRHVGDLGNIEANEDGVATIEMTDEVISLSGDDAIVGKSLMIHAGEDKFTQPTGDAGARVAFGVIEKQ
ncbi:superoxide dismutase family protein [Roseiconus nitratireducens]|uniref:Superoxide dismutase family protein n=2 Tax=Roseiconus nitratireducens TaxID=2605748 RepID=A0A5M6DA25_9BACT|nr:superoxide dismutase family protein [Roseiconus nitratireducens]